MIVRSIIILLSSEQSRESAYIVWSVFKVHGPQPPSLLSAKLPSKSINRVSVEVLNEFTASLEAAQATDDVDHGRLFGLCGRGQIERWWRPSSLWCCWMCIMESRLVMFRFTNSQMWSVQLRRFTERVPKSILPSSVLGPVLLNFSRMRRLISRLSCLKCSAWSSGPPSGTTG